MAAGPWASAIGSAVSFVDSIWYTGQEKAEHELAREGLDVQRETLATQERIAQQQQRTAFLTSAQDTSRARTYAVAGVAVVGLIVAGVVVVT